MINLSMAEACRLYGELVEAYHGINGFGGNTAELYLYRFGYSLTDKSLLPSTDAADLARANESLYNLIAFFLKKYDRAVVTVNDRSFGEWVKTAGFNHRVHVHVSEAK